MAERRSPLAAYAPAFAAAGGSGAVRLAELPFLTQVGLRVDAESPAAGRLARALDAPLPVEPNTFARSGELTVLWLGPDEWLVVGPGGAQAALVERLASAAGAEHVSVVDVSARRTTLAVAGPRARDLLAHGCALDLHPDVFGTGRCAQTMLARANVVLVARSDSAPEFWVLCGSSYAGYMADWLLDAATEYTRQ